MRRAAPAWLAPLALAALLGALLALAGCASQAPNPEPPPVQSQPLTFRVLDAHDRPVSGARLAVTPLAGQPRQPGPYVSDAQGLVDLPWAPLAVDEAAGTHTRDRIYAYRTRLRYQVEAEGFLPARGELETQAQGRQLHELELKKLGSQAVVGRRTQTVVLRRLNDLLGPDLARRPADDPLARRCLDFYKKDRDLVAGLGVAFAWPSFHVKDDLLRVRLDWLGKTWSGLSKAPLAGQVALTAGLPLAMVVAEDLLPAPGVGRVSLEFLSEIPPEGPDPHAPPVRARVVVAAPVQTLMDLAQGRLDPDGFLARFPPRLEVEGPVAAAPFGDER